VDKMDESMGTSPTKENALSEAGRYFSQYADDAKDQIRLTITRKDKGKKTG
jgi:hypothetical protein